jgi:hypothetical protein
MSRLNVGLDFQRMEQMARSRLAVFAVIASLLLPSFDSRAQEPATTKEDLTKSDAKSETVRKKRRRPIAEKTAETKETSATTGTSTENNSAINKATEEREKSGNPIAEIMDKLDYPELQVVPRASERLKIEAEEERSSWYWTHWQIEVSGLSTLWAATTLATRPDLNDNEKSDAESILQAGQVLGAGWLIAGAALGYQRPYRSGVNAIAKYPGRDTRSAIMRERLAEEALEKPARLMGPIKTAAIISNLAINIGMGIYATDEGRITAGIAALLAFLPAMYPDHNIRIYEKHLEYKTKIYGPLGSLVPRYDFSSKTYAPLASLTWRF